MRLLDILKEKTQKKQVKHHYKPGEVINIIDTLKQDKIYFDIDGVEYHMTQEQYRDNLKKFGLFPSKT